MIFKLGLGEAYLNDNPGLTLPHSRNIGPYAFMLETLEKMNRDTL